MAKGKKFNVADSKRNKNTVNLPKSSEAKEEVVEKKNDKRKMIRINAKEHKMAKFNKREMQLQKYIEALIHLDRVGAVDWNKYEED